jgi:hypothetical protein
MIQKMSGMYIPMFFTDEITRKIPKSYKEWMKLSTFKWISSDLDEFYIYRR